MYSLWMEYFLSHLLILLWWHFLTTTSTSTTTTTWTGHGSLLWYLVSKKNAWTCYILLSLSSSMDGFFFFCMRSFLITFIFLCTWHQDFINGIHFLGIKAVHCFSSVSYFVWIQFVTSHPKGCYMYIRSFNNLVLWDFKLSQQCSSLMHRTNVHGEMTLVLLQCS